MTSKSGPISVPPVSVIAGVQGALPPNRFSQGDIADAFLAMPGFAEHEDLVRGLYRAAKVGHRHFVLPLDGYLDLSVRPTICTSRTPSNWGVPRCRPHWTKQD